MGCLNLTAVTAPAEINTVPIASTNNWTPLTFVAWAKKTYDTAEAGQGAILTVGAGGATPHAHCLHIEYRTGGTGDRLRMLTYDGSYRNATAASIPSATWAALVGDVTTNATSTTPYSRSAWMNGSTGTPNSNSAAPAGLSVFGIGTAAAGYGIFNGRLAHVAAFQGILTADQRAAWDSGSNAFEVEAMAGGTATLVAYYPGNIITIAEADYIEDVSGNAYHLPVAGTGITYDGTDEPTVNPIGSGFGVLGTAEIQDLTRGIGPIRAAGLEGDLQ